jgi:hypothetical protein
MGCALEHALLDVMEIVDVVANRPSISLRI